MMVPKITSFGVKTGKCTRFSQNENDAALAFAKPNRLIAFFCTEGGMRFRFGGARKRDRRMTWRMSEIAYEVLTPRRRISFQQALIPLVALIAILLLAQTPIGSTYRTLLGYSQSERTAEVLLANVHDAKVDIAIASQEDGGYIILTLEERSLITSKEMTLTVPENWHLEEVRGVHIKQIGKYVTQKKLMLFIPVPADKVELRFTSTVPLDFIAFAHNGESPVLLTLTNILMPGREVVKHVQLVEEKWLFGL